MMSTSLTSHDIFSRNELLLGTDILAAIGRVRVAVFGVGGVGSWCAEGLVRSGVMELTIVDCDRICPSNINRQLMATTNTVGRLKVEALKERLLSINPEAHITALPQLFCEETAADFFPDDVDNRHYDYVIDAIDSLKDKALLILKATQSGATLFSSMGAALKLDSTRIRVAEFWKVQGDPLARCLRKKFKHMGLFPTKKFLCVYSDELLSNQPSSEIEAEESTMIVKAQTNGSLVHITAIVGFTLSGLLVQNVCAKYA